VDMPEIKMSCCGPLPMVLDEHQRFFFFTMNDLGKLNIFRRSTPNRGSSGGYHLFTVRDWFGEEKKSRMYNELFSTEKGNFDPILDQEDCYVLRSCVVTCDIVEQIMQWMSSVDITEGTLII
jgi:hypothetical protein